MTTSCRTFGWCDQEEFACISGDYNPIHMDPVSARRTHAGAPIVHGIHSLLWALECVAQSEYNGICAKSLKVQFLRPIYIGDKVTLEISRKVRTTVRIRITVDTEEVVIASLSTEHASRSRPDIGQTSFSPMPSLSQPNDFAFEHLAGMRGLLSRSPMVDRLRTLFPAATALFGSARLAALMSSSYLVGMVVPGLHSMFSGLDVLFTEDPAGQSSEGMEFAVVSTTERFRLVRIGICGRGLTGTLETINRLPPVRQAGMKVVLSRVSAGEFRNSTALVIGGSRGLGELTCKLLAAGGARVILTYAAGESDANSLVKEISEAGFECCARPYNIRQPASEQLESLELSPTHLYYFATPPIFRRKSGLFDIVRFNEFNLFYVTSFFDLVQVCSHLSPTGIRVFYPSSTAVDVRPGTMTEYAMSKAAAEILCSDLSKFAPGVQVFTHRLPRLPTDQTSSVVQAETLDPIDVLLPMIRKLHEGCAHAPTRASA